MDSPDAAITETVASRARRLAVIVFTDVVGYSAMVHADEAGALDRVRADLDAMRAK
ncbi:MAG: hypothetical protein ABIU58_07115 [Ramlibacter sp.]